MTQPNKIELTELLSVRRLPYDRDGLMFVIQDIEFGEHEAYCARHNARALRDWLNDFLEGAGE